MDERCNCYDGTAIIWNWIFDQRGKCHAVLVAMMYIYIHTHTHTHTLYSYIYQVSYLM